MQIAIRPPYLVPHPAHKDSPLEQQVILYAEHQDDYPLLKGVTTAVQCCGFREQGGLVTEAELILSRNRESNLITQAEAIVGCKVHTREAPAIPQPPLAMVDSAATIPPPA